MDTDDNDVVDVDDDDENDIGDKSVELIGYTCAPTHTHTRTIYVDGLGICQIKRT